MNILSDIKVLDSLLALNLTITLWSARRKMTLSDFGNAELPPEDLASLGSKRIADPDSLKIFSTLKARAFNYLDRHGVRFMSGWAIPEDKAGDVITELISIRDNFFREKEAFLADYDQSIENWINKHTKWAGIIRESTVGSEYVRSRFSFAWQLYRVAPLTEHRERNAVLESGLQEEVEGLAGTLFREISASADEIWKNVYMGRDSVTHKALSPLRTLQNKLAGLPFIEPHVAPVAQLIQTGINAVPPKGNITGKDLLMLQGIVSMLRDPLLMLEHSQKVIAGQHPRFVLEQACSASETIMPEGENTEEYPVAMPEIPELDPVVEPVASTNIPSLGLW